MRGDPREAGGEKRSGMERGVSAGRRLLLGLVCLTLVIGRAAGEIRWNRDTAGQEMMVAYMENVNRFLLEEGEQPVNSLFEMYRSFAVMGITMMDNAEVPEGVEITFQLYADCINSVQVRVTDSGRFPRIAAAFLRALYPETSTAEEAFSRPIEIARKAVTDPGNSYVETVEELNGTVPRVYYAYYPDEYHDGVPWLQMTIAFPMAGYWDGTGVINTPVETKAPDTWSGNDADYEGYFSQDDYRHLEIFSTPTPEPDSPAAEQDPRGW